MEGKVISIFVSDMQKTKSSKNVKNITYFKIKKNNKIKENYNDFKKY